MTDSLTLQTRNSEAKYSALSSRPSPPPLITHDASDDHHQKPDGSRLMDKRTRVPLPNDQETVSNVFTSMNRSVSSSTSITEPHGSQELLMNSIIPMDSVDILQTFDKAMETIMDKRLKDLEKDRLEVSFDVFDKWVEGNGTRRYRPDNPNAVSQKAGWAMQQISSRDNVVEKICAGVIMCTSCHVNYTKRIPMTTDERRMKPAYHPPSSEGDHRQASGRKCPENECNGWLLHKRCRGFFDNPVMHRWHSFNDAIVLESLGIHDHPRPVKDYPEPEPALITSTLQSQNSSTTRYNTSPKQKTESPGLHNNRSTAGQSLKSTSNRNYATSPTNPSSPFFTDDSDMNIVNENSEISGGIYALTMGIVGCLPDNVQKAMKSFSIKPEKQHITFSFPFMANIIRQTAQLSSAHHQSRGLHHVTPMLLCDHSLNLIDGFDVVLTLAADVESCLVCVVHMTIYQSGSKEGVKQHYATLLQTILESLPPDLPVTTHFKLPTFVMLSDDCDPDEIATPLAETLMTTSRAADFLASGASPNEVVLGLKENVILPCIMSRPFAFRVAVTDVTSKLPDQDSERFVALAQYLLSDKCSESELQKTDLLLKDPAFVPTAIRKFWALWGHELIAPKIFPIAKTLWDSDELVEKDHASEEGIQNWRTIFRLKYSSQTLSFREILQRLVQTLKAQGPIDEDSKDSKRNTNPLSPSYGRATTGLLSQPLTGTNTSPTPKTGHMFLNNNSILPEEGLEKLHLASKESIFSNNRSTERSSSVADAFGVTSDFGVATPLPLSPAARDNHERQYPCSLFWQSSPLPPPQPERPSPSHRHHPFSFIPSSHRPLLPSRVPPAFSAHVRHHDPLLMIAPPRRSDYFSRVFPPRRTPSYFHTQKLLSLDDDRSRMRELHVRTNQTGSHIAGLLNTQSFNARR